MVYLKREGESEKRLSMLKLWAFKVFKFEKENSNFGVHLRLDVRFWGYSSGFVTRFWSQIF